MLGDGPAVIDGELDDILVQVLLTCDTHRLTPRAVAFVGTSVACALNKYKHSAPRAAAAVVWLARNNDERVAKEAQKLAGRRTADTRAAVGVSQLRHAVLPMTRSSRKRRASYKRGTVGCQCPMTSPRLLPSLEVHTTPAFHIFLTYSTAKLCQFR